ncbi:MAG TPA: LysR family transcriptional regulator [Kofleriaceae bacterium]|nr:LysR family transcriptional regulator [Kofleriaceae bacterium]
MPRWDDVRYFLEVHRRGSLSAAGRALGVNHTTVGRRLKALEREVGARLLRITTSGAALTDAGRAILPDSEQLEATMLALRRKVVGRDGSASGSVRIATTEALASTFLIPRLATLRARHPDLDVVIAASNRAVDLARGEADLALRLVDSRDGSLVARRVGKLRLGVFAASDYLGRRGVPAAEAGFAGHDTLGYHGELAAGPEMRWLAIHAARARSVVRVNSVLNLLAAAAAGLGIAVLPDGLCSTHPALRRLDVAAPPDGRDVWVVFHRDARSNVRVKTVVSDLISATRGLEMFARPG